MFDDPLAMVILVGIPFAFWLGCSMFVGSLIHKRRKARAAAQKLANRSA